MSARRDQHGADTMTRRCSVMVLDGQGVVRANVTDWSWIVACAGAPHEAVGEGASYLDHCARVQGAAAIIASEVAERIRRVITGETDFDVFRRRLAGNPHEHECVETTILPLSRRTPRRVVVAHLDITESSQCEFDRQRHTEVLTKLLEGVSDFGMLMIDPNGVIRCWNAGAEALFGYTKEEVVGRSYDFLFSTEGFAAGDSWIELDESETGVTARLGVRLRKDGSKSMTATSVHPLRDQHDRLYSFAMIIRDVSAEWASQRELDRVMAELEARNRMLEQFAYTVSHDLKTPIMTISGFTKHLKNDLSRGHLDRVEGFLERIEAATSKMSAMVTDLLEYSRLGQSHGEPERIHPTEVIDEIVAGLQPIIASKEAEVIVQRSMPALKADRRQFVAAMENLIGNALTHGCPRPGMTIEVSAERCEEDGADHVRLSVRDHGPGVEPAHRERIFTLFERFDLAAEGSGVGLAIVRRIVESHAGRVWVEAPHGGGTQFVVSLPVDAKSPAASSESADGGADLEPRMAAAR